MVGCASRPYGFGAGWLFPFNIFTKALRINDGDTGKGVARNGIDKWVYMTLNLTQYAWIIWLLISAPGHKNIVVYQKTDEDIGVVYGMSSDARPPGGFTERVNGENSRASAASYIRGYESRYRNVET